jgi:predicted DNA binding CopG/RHH family protein
MKQTKKRKLPAFATEAEEARWWDQNRDRLDQDFEKAARAGKLRPLDSKTLAARIAASRTISIRLAEADIALARKQAAARGLPYQTYIKSVLHQGLVAAESSA